MYDLSIVIPARNEDYLAITVENILQNIRGNTEVIVVLDGYWSDPGVPDAKNVTVIYNHDAVGQRAAQNQAVRVSKAKYIMKIDAHCKVDEGFDVKMMSEMKDHWTMVPTLYNLHMFDWLCPDGHRLYQGPTPKNGCLQCGKPVKKDIIFKKRDGRKSNFYCFDKTLHFQYFGELGNRPGYDGDIAPTFSLQGSCFMITREKYWQWNVCDEVNLPSWGQQGVEVALKTWFSGGEVMVNKKTWYAHMFRTQGGDFGFPYDNPQSAIDKAREYTRKQFLEGEYKGVHDLNWLLEKFKPVKYWHYPVNTNKKPSTGVVYYTHGVGDPLILEGCRRQIVKKCIGAKHVTSVSLTPLDFGKNIVLNEPAGYLTMAKQILAGLEASTAEVIFFCEHDVLYHPSHFDFIPLRPDVIYYNTNVWRVRYQDGHALYCNDLKQLSGLVAYRNVLIEHYKKRVKLLQDEYDCTIGSINMSDNKDLMLSEFNKYVRQQGFEPGTHNRAERVDDLTCDAFQSAYPNLDIRHDTNTTPSRWNKDQFRNQKFTDGWTERKVSEISGWDIIDSDIKKYLASL